MNKLKYLILTSVLLVSLCGCSKKVDNTLDLSEIKYISELATIKTYYHNVAKVEYEAQSGLTHIFEKDRILWLEYTGIAKIGIDMSKIDVKKEDNKIKITIPPAKVLSHDVDESTIVKIKSKDGINPNPVPVSEETAAIKRAEDNMIETIEKDGQLLLQAQDRAKELIENYVRQFNVSGEEYTIEWIELKESM